jgi:hypothetical protein
MINPRHLLGFDMATGIHRKHVMVRLVPLLVAVAAALVVVAPTAAAPPAATSVQIEQQATLVTGGVVVTLDLQCPAGTSVFVDMTVKQEGAVAAGNPVDVSCTGAKQKVNEIVPGAFTAGSADAGVFVSDFQVNGFDQDQRVISIS